MEAAAIYYSLKRISNVQGYKIVDLNYPTLAKLVSDINRWNVEINILDMSIILAMTQAGQMYQKIDSAHQGLDLQILHNNQSQHLGEVIGKLLETLDQYCTEMNMLSQDFKDCKVS